MNIALILAGGTGNRLGSEVPKQFLEVKNKPIISYCLDVFGDMAAIDKIWVVAQECWHDLIRGVGGEKLCGFSKPGANRQLSILNGLEDIADFASMEDIVVIHDAARPLVTERLLADCLNACEEHDGALPVLPMKDTLYLGEEGKIHSLVERQKVFAGQAPEAFSFGRYLDAVRALLPDKIFSINGSTEPAILAGMDIALVDGDERNFKITTQEDLIKFQEIAG